MSSISRCPWPLQTCSPKPPRLIECGATGRAEPGCGFAVVASEVRRLSQQSARAARDLTQLAAHADQTLGGVTLMLNFEVQEPDGLRLGHP